MLKVQLSTPLREPASEWGRKLDFAVEQDAPAKSALPLRRSTRSILIRELGF